MKPGILLRPCNLRPERLEPSSDAPEALTTKKLRAKYLNEVFKGRCVSLLEILQRTVQLLQYRRAATPAGRLKTT